MLRFMRAFLIVFVLTLASSTGAQDTTATATYLTLSPDGAYAAYVENGVLQVGGTATWQAVPVPESAKSGVQALAWHADSTMLAVGTDKSEVIVFAVGEAAASRAVSTFAEPIAMLYHPDYDPNWEQLGVVSLDWSPDGRYLASTTVFGAYQTMIWDAETWDAPIALKTGDSSLVSWSNHSGRFIVANIGGMRIADVADVVIDPEESVWWDRTRQLADKAPDPRFSVPVWSHDDTEIIVSTWFGDLYSVDIATGEARQFGELDPKGEGAYFYIVRDIVYDEERGIAYTAVSSQDITQNLTRIMAWDVANSVLLNTIEVQARVVQFDLDPATGEPVFAATFAPADAPAPRDVPLGFRAPG